MGIINQSKLKQQRSKLPYLNDLQATQKYRTLFSASILHQRFNYHIIRCLLQEILIRKLFAQLQERQKVYLQELMELQQETMKLLALDENEKQP